MSAHTFKVFKLHFTTPLHIGKSQDDYGISLKNIESDTIYAALTATLPKLGKEVPKDGDLGCCISSLFPFYQKEKNSPSVLFFPKPLKQPLINIADSTLRKKIKKVCWLDKTYFEQQLNGIPMNIENDSNDIVGEYILKNKELIPKDEKIISSHVSVRATISRNGEDTKPYYIDRLFFTDYSGLFFLADGDTTLLEEALTLLQHEGIGTDRNVGNGSFEYSKETITITYSSESNHVLSLSSFIPESKEQLSQMLDDKNIAYNIARRGGWITTPPFTTFRKNAIYAFTASSVFKSALNGVHIAGKLVNLNPKIEFTSSPMHPIWRCGKSIFIPIKI